MTTSCAPIPFIFVKEAFAFAVEFRPRCPKRGICLAPRGCSSPACWGLRRCDRKRGFPAEFEIHYPRRRAILLFPWDDALSKKIVRALPRSVEMITHRPVIGSFRNSGKAILLEEARATREERAAKGT